MESRFGSHSWLVLACMTMLFCLSGQSCLPPTPVFGGKELAGTYSGLATLNMSMSSDSFPESITSSTQMQFSVTLNDDGRPQNLGLPAFGQGSSPIVTSLFTPGESQTSTTSLQITSGGTDGTVTVDVTATFTAVVAEVTASGFHATYDFTITGTYSGGPLDGATISVTGRATYDGEVNGDTLTYRSSVTEDLTSTMPGAGMQTAHYVISLDASLTRQ